MNTSELLEWALRAGADPAACQVFGDVLLEYGLENIPLELAPRVLKLTTGQDWNFGPKGIGGYFETNATQTTPIWAMAFYAAFLTQGWQTTRWEGGHPGLKLYDSIRVLIDGYELREDLRVPQVHCDILIHNNERVDPNG